MRLGAREWGRLARRRAAVGGRWRRAAPIAVAAGLLTPSAAMGGGWGVVSAPSPLVPTGSFSGVSCTSTDACMAAGSLINAADGNSPLIERLTAAGWTSQNVPEPPNTSSEELNGISCPSGRSCVAVGFASSGSTYEAVAEIWDGTSWRLVAMPSPGGSGQINPSAVACVSSTNCTVVGSVSYGSGLQAQSMLIEHWNGSGWAVQVATNPSGYMSGSLNAISCPTATTCDAIGTASGSSTSVPLAMELQGTNWTPEPMPEPQGAGYSQLNSVSCPAADSCEAIGYTIPAVQGSDYAPLAEHWDGSSWTLQATPPVTYGSSGPPENETWSFMQGISCENTTDCTAVGYETPLFAGEFLTLIEHWNGSRWSIQNSVNPAGSSGPELLGVWCAGSGGCVAVGVTDDPLSGNPEPLAEVSSAATWAQQQTAPNQPPHQSVLKGVSCPASGRCVAVGWTDSDYRYGQGGDVFGPVAESWDGASWSLQPIATPATDDSSTLSAVSCPTSSFCMAVGSAYNLNDGTTPFAETWDGSTWTDVNAADPEGAFSSAYSVLTGVSCTSPASCVAVGTDESTEVAVTLAEVWNGHAWTIEPSPDAPGSGIPSFLDAVSCASAGDCSAVGYSADPVEFDPTSTLAEHWNGLAWTVEPTPAPAESNDALNGVSCIAGPPASCTAVGYQGASMSTQPTDGQTLVERWDGTGWSLQPSPTPGLHGALTSVSCTSASFCAAVGNYDSGVPTQEVDHTLAESWDGTAWTAVVSPTPTGWLAVIDGVSCVSAAECDAVGEQQSPGSWPNIDWLPIAEQYTGAGVPSATSPPTITGTPAEGDTLTVTDGSWSASPTGYVNRWEDCDQSGSNCMPIAGATGQTYKLTAADVGSTIVVSESASNSAGDGATVSSVPTTPVSPLAPPVSSAPPTITGSAVQGQKLTEKHGSWSGHPTDYSYQWEDCGPDGAQCAAIAGAVSPSYTLTAADAGSTIGVLEIASNDGGGGEPAVSAASAIVLPLPPSNAGPPSIDGDLTAGQTLTETHGTWSNNPTAYSYQWLRCDPGCDPIAGATAQSYVLSTADVGAGIEVQETASNAGGTGGPATSVATAPIAAARTASPNTRPAAAIAPAITGSPVVGDTLEASTGAWTAVPAPVFGFQWQACTATCANIPEATKPELTISAAELGDRLQVVVGAENAAGVGFAVSALTGPVLAPGPTSFTLGLDLKRQLRPKLGRRVSRVALLAHRGTAFNLTVPSPGLLTIDWYMARARHPKLLASARTRFPAAESSRIVLRLTPAGAHAIETKRAVRIEVTATFVTVSGTRAAVDGRFTVTPTRAGRG